MKIENYKYTVDEAFRDCFYVVPDYQREYVWTEKQINQLLNDIDENSGSSSPEYFIGNILVSPREEKNHFDVIDGQQRLTTIFLILCALRAVFDKKKMKQSETIKNRIEAEYPTPQGDIKIAVRLEPQYENVGEVIKKIVDTNSDPKNVKTNIEKLDKVYGSVENILDAYRIIYEFLESKYDNEEEMKSYWGYLTNNVVFIQISTDVSSALKIFETINERGIGLNPMDLLKNLLFTRVLAKKFPKLKREWKKVTKPLEKNKEKPLRFLRYFLMANYKIKNERNVLREDEIYEWLSNRDNAYLTTTQDKSFEFVRKIIQNVDLYIDFINGRNNRGNPSPAMKYLKELTGGAFSFHYILLLSAEKLPESIFEQFVKQIESFLFYHIFTKTPSKYLERRFSIWADEIREIADIENPEEQCKKINTFIRKSFYEDMEKKDSELTAALSVLTLRSMQKYRIRYLLARLTEHVEKAWGHENTLEYYLKLQIEHILPNTPERDLLDAWQEQNSEYDYEEMKDRLGNLTLLETPLNIVARNGFYKEKLPEYEKSGNYLTSSLCKLEDVGKNSSVSRINDNLSSCGEWDAKCKWGAKDIEQRQSVLIKLAREIWKITDVTIPRR